MTIYQDDILAEVRMNKAKVMTMYGGLDGLLKHMDEERPQLEAQGWKFTDIEEVYKDNFQRQMKIN
jgi:hypothetical protein